MKEGDARLLSEGTKEERDPMRQAKVDAAMNCNVACVELSMISRTSPIRPDHALDQSKHHTYVHGAQKWSSAHIPRPRSVSRQLG